MLYKIDCKTLIEILEARVIPTDMRKGDNRPTFSKMN